MAPITIAAPKVAAPARRNPPCARRTTANRTEERTAVWPRATEKKLPERVMLVAQTATIPVTDATRRTAMRLFLVTNELDVSAASAKTAQTASTIANGVL